MPGIWRNFKVKVRHNRGEEDKFTSFIDNYDAVMEMIKKELSEDECNTLKKDLDEVVED